MKAIYPDKLLFQRNIAGPPYLPFTGQYKLLSKGKKVSLRLFSLRIYQAISYEFNPYVCWSDPHLVRYLSLIPGATLIERPPRTNFDTVGIVSTEYRCYTPGLKIGWAAG